MLVGALTFRLAGAFLRPDSQAGGSGMCCLCGLFACYGLAVEWRSTAYWPGD